MEHPEPLKQTASSSRRAASLKAPAHQIMLSGGQRVVPYAMAGRRASAGETPLTPLLLVHSIHAPANAFEMEPVALRQSRRRPVVALDLPGFGGSYKPDRSFTPAMTQEAVTAAVMQEAVMAAIMQEAVTAAMGWIETNTASGPMDVMALSLRCEIAAQAVLQQPHRVRRLTLLSPTGMEGRRVKETHEDGRTREMKWMKSLLRNSRLGRGLCRMLTTRASIHWFLSRSWGTHEVGPRSIQHGSDPFSMPAPCRTSNCLTLSTRPISASCRVALPRRAQRPVATPPRRPSRPSRKST